MGRGSCGSLQAVLICIYELNQKGRVSGERCFESQRAPYKRQACVHWYSSLILLMHRLESFKGPVNVGFLPSVFFNATIFQGGLSLLGYTSILKIQGQPRVPTNTALAQFSLGCVSRLHQGRVRLWDRTHALPSSKPAQLTPLLP